MMGVLTYYMLLTAAPLKQNKKYQELLPQNTALTSYVRYFWGSAQPYLRTKETADCTLVIPDTCVDFAGLMTQAFGITTTKTTDICAPFLQSAFLRGAPIRLQRTP